MSLAQNVPAEKATPLDAAKLASSILSHRLGTLWILRDDEQSDYIARMIRDAQLALAGHSLDAILSAGVAV